MTFEPANRFAETAPCDETVVAQVSALWTRLSPAPFDAAETRVLALADGDTLASVEPAGRIDNVVAVLFGRRAGGRRLADPRLEALRRAAVVARHRHHLPDTEAARLREAGYDEAQVRAVERRAAA